MKKLLLILLIFISIGCKDESPIKTESFNFIIKEKVIMDGDEYYIRSIENKVERCSAEQYIGWDVGDTLKMERVLEGFYRNEVYLIE